MVHGRRWVYYICGAYSMSGILWSIIYWISAGFCILVASLVVIFGLFVLLARCKSKFEAAKFRRFNNYLYKRYSKDWKAEHVTSETMLGGTERRISILEPEPEPEIFSKIPQRFEHDFDITGKRSPNFDEVLNFWLLHGGMEVVNNYVNTWLEECKKAAGAGSLKARIMMAKSDGLAFKADFSFVFNIVRKTTVYRQRDGRKYAEKQDIIEDTRSYTYEQLLEKYNSICNENVVDAQFKQRQRQLMTRELRERIMKRDNYTCQMCGRYMPDEFGLEIDHIVPVARGGETVEWNLQVLCEKCNGSKHDKL